MSIENIKQGSVITDKVSLLLRNGENEKALDLLGQNYGPLARNAMEKVMKYSNLSQDEMVRVFGKISDILENVADKISRHERLNEKKEKAAAAREQAEDAAELAAIQAEAMERRKKFEDRMRWVEEQKQKLAEERRQLEEQRRFEKDVRKRREIEEKLKRLEERKKHLETERRNLEKIREENQNGSLARTDGRTGRDNAGISSSFRNSDGAHAPHTPADTPLRTPDNISTPAAAGSTSHTPENAHSTYVSNPAHSGNKAFETAVLLKSRTRND